MAKLRAGQLRKIVTIQRALKTVSDSGSTIKTWENIKQTRASVEPLSGNETFINEAIKNRVDHLIMLRRTNLDPADRIILGSRIFDLVQVLDYKERGVELLCLAKENLTEVFVVDPSYLTTQLEEPLITENNCNLIWEQ